MKSILNEEFDTEYGTYWFTIYGLDNPNVELTTPELDFKGNWHHGNYQKSPHQYEIEGLDETY